MLIFTALAEPYVNPYAGEGKPWHINGDGTIAVNGTHIHKKKPKINVYKSLDGCSDNPNLQPYQQKKCYDKL